MTSMKHLLRLVGALALSTGAATSVVACGNPDVKVSGLDKQVAEDLGLQKDGKGTEALKIGDDIKWTIDAVTTPVTADKLLEGTKAKSEASYNFITQTLGVKPEKEGKWNEADFKAADLAAIKATVSDITATLAETKEKTDLSVTAGTYNIQFTKDEGKTNVGGKYSLPLAVSDTGIVNPTITTITTDLAVANTDVATNASIKFAIGETPSGGEVKGVAITLKDAFKTKMDDLGKLIGKTIEVKASGKPAAEDGKWAANDKLEITYSTGDVTFGHKSELKLA